MGKALIELIDHPNGTVEFVMKSDLGKKEMDRLLKDVRSGKDSGRTLNANLLAAQAYVLFFERFEINRQQILQQLLDTTIGKQSSGDPVVVDQAVS